MIQGEHGDIPVVIVAGMGKENRVIGKDNELLWHVPEDLKRFKKLTLGHPIIMGRKTFESILNILGKPLPGRTNIIVTRNNNYNVEGIKTAPSLEEAFSIATQENPTEIHIGGGAQMYELALPYVDRLHLTYFHDNKVGDTFFPPFKDQFTATQEYKIESHEGLEFQWVDYVRST